MNHYEHKHFIDITYQTVNEFGAGFCTECGEIVDNGNDASGDQNNLNLDNKIINDLPIISQKISELEVEIQKRIAASVGDMQTNLQELRDKEQLMRSTIKDAMASSGIKKFGNDYISVTYVASTTRKGFDTAKFKKEQPGLYDQYEKLSNVSDSIRITIKLPKGDK